MANVVPLDVDTGEIAFGYTLISPEQKRAYRDRQAYNDREKGSHWVSAYHDSIGAIVCDLSLTHAGAILKLLPYMRFKADGKLINNGKPLKQTEIQRIFKRSKRATIDILSELCDIGVINIVKEGRSNVFYVTADYHTMGYVTDGAKFTKVYQRKLQEVIEDLSLNDVGLLYKILPYFHFSEYYLVSNPDETDVSKIEHLTREHLAALIGHDADTVTRVLSKLRGRKALMSTSSGNTTRYLVHPDLMFRQQMETEWTRAVRKMFEQHDK